MTTINAYNRQPTKQDYADRTKFKFSIFKLPKVEYFCTAANIPAISLGSDKQATPFKDIPYPGDKISYSDLVITFLVDENLENYQEIHGWLRGLGFAGGHTEFKDLLNSGADRFPTSTGEVMGDAGRTKYGTPSQGGTFSDATLTILSSKNNPITEVRFKSIFPISLSGLDYNQQPTDIDYLTASVTFQYKIYDFATVNSRSTTITNS